jgi:O-antigen/teichoic acid export membrane protein
VTTILVIRKLDVEMYGTYNLLLKFIVIYNIFSESPISTVFNRYIPELVDNRDGARLRKLIITGLVITVVSVLGISIPLYVLGDWIAGFFNMAQFRDYNLSLFAYIFTMVFRLALVSILTSFLRHKQTSVLHLVSSLLRSALLIALLPVLNIHILLLIEAVTSVVYIVPGIRLVRRFIAQVSAQTPVDGNRQVSRKRVLTYGMYSSMNELGAGMVGKTSDYFIVSALSNLQNVGIYSFATRIYDLIFKLLPFKEMMTVIRPLFFMKFNREHKHEDFLDIYNLMVKLLIPVFMIPVLYFAVFGKSLILYVFDPKYISAYLVCVLVLASNLYYPFFFPISLVMQLRERMDIALKSKIVVVFSIFAGIWAMKRFGIIGVATVTLIGDFLKNLLILVMLRKDINIVYRLRELKNYLLVFIALNVPFFFVINYFNNLAALLLGSLLYFPLTFVLIVKFHPFTPFDLGILEKLGQSSGITKKVRKITLMVYHFKLW